MYQYLVTWRFGGFVLAKGYEGTAQLQSAKVLTDLTSQSETSLGVDTGARLESLHTL